ncbi:MAG: tetratricopeptide repeat protein, partial [Deltaproteobacteria bacterium]|nr:tetratricopeptide repeat protein [Deltaproteobacteria bacterium]
MNYVLGLIVIFLLWPAQLSDTASAFDQNRAVALNQKGQKLLQESKFTQALEVFRELRLVCQTDKYCNGIALFGMATCQFELATYEDAMRSLEEADAIFSELNKPLERARVLKSIGEIFATKTDYDSALKYLEKARAACTQAGRDGTAELFWILTGMANANIYLSRPQQATKNLDDAEALMAGRLQPLQDALLQYLAGRIAQDRQDYKLAKERLSSALKYFERVDNRKRVQSILNAMGLMEEHQANYPEAQRLYDRALAIAQSIKDPAETAFIYNNLGSVLWKRGNYDQAKRSYEEALKIRRDLGIRLHYADTLNNLGIVQIAYGNYSQAFEKFKEAYNIAREIGSPLVQAWTLHDMAWLYKDQGNLMESQRFSLQAVDLAKKTPDKRLLATVLLRLGNLHEYYGDFEGALKHYNEAERNYNEIREWLYRSNTLLDIASIYTRQGAPEDAKPKFEEALVIKRKIGAPTGEAFCKFALFYLEKYQYLEDKDRVTPAQRQFDLGQADAHLRQAQKAIDPEDKNALMLLGYARGRYLLEVDPAGSIGQFASLKDLAKSTGSLKYSFLASVGLGLANEKLGKLDEAEKAFEDAVNYAEDIRKTLDPDTRRTFLHGEEILGMKHVVPYEGLARVRLKKGDHAKSLEASEFTKARSFADKMARSIPGAAFGVEAKVLDDLEKVENQIRSNHRRITECTAKGGDSALVPDLTRHRENLDENLLRLEQRIRKEYPDFYAVRFPSRLPIAESGLRDGEVVLAYEVTDTGVLVFLLKGKKIVEANFKEVARKYLDNLVRKFRQPFEDVGKTDDPKEQQRYLASFDPRVGKELYDLLLKDTVGRLQAGERIAIVPDDCLSVLPFEML